MAWVSPVRNIGYRSDVRYPVISTDDDWITFDSLGLYSDHDRIPWTYVTGKSWIYSKEEDIIDALLEKYS